MADKKSPTLGQAVDQVLAQVQEPMSIDDFATRVLAICPSKAKNPLTSIRSHLRLEQAGKTLVLLDRKTLVPLHVAMKGVRFRIPLTRQDVTQGVLNIVPAFEYFYRQGLNYDQMKLMDVEGRQLPVRLKTLKQTHKSPFGSHTREIPAFDLSDWFSANRARRNDAVLVTVADWDQGRFRLEHEPNKRRREAEVERQNQALADLLFDMLEASQHEWLAVHQAIPTAYVRLTESRVYPGDHWAEVVMQDERMRWDGFAIRYSDFESPLEAMLEPAHSNTQRQSSQADDPHLASMVYRFKATLAYRKDIWRRLEIQGEQSLADFDLALRDAFQHDTVDHLGGFWRLVRRGKSNRFREVELGTINPFGEGEAAEQSIAGLGLEPGEELKYVYDFGDWIEHRLTLEEIVEPEAEAQYPQVMAQNEPQYQDCQVCQEENRKTRATWCCLECSNEQGQDVLVCESCLYEAHEDHYADEILY